jgi:hypothetical protein
LEESPALEVVTYEKAGKELTSNKKISAAAGYHQKLNK